MFTATGISVDKHRNGTITVTALVTNDRTGDAKRETVTGRSLVQCQQELQARVEEMAAKDLDQALRASIEGRVLAQSGVPTPEQGRG